MDMVRLTVCVFVDYACKFNVNIGFLKPMLTIIHSTSVKVINNRC